MMMGQFGQWGQPPMGKMGGKGKMDQYGMGQQQMQMGQQQMQMGMGKMEGKGKGKKEPKPERLKEEWEMEEDMMFSQIEATCAGVQHLEKEWNSEEFNKKIGGYMRKAGKNAGGKSWQLIVESFVEKFYTLIGTACYDHGWLETADWALPVSSAIKAYAMTPEQSASASSDEYFGYVADRCSLGHDQARYDVNAHEIVKNVIPNKVAQKKVREAVDTSRENVVKQTQPNPEAFIQAWVQQTTELIAADSFRNNPTATLTKADAERLFDELVQTNGIPMWLEQVAGKPPRGCQAVRDAVATAYAGHAELPPRAPKGFGKDGFGGKGKDAWGGGCGGGYGKDAWGGCGKGGGFGKDAWGGGYSPY